MDSLFEDVFCFKKWWFSSHYVSLLEGIKSPICSSKIHPSKTSGLTLTQLRKFFHCEAGLRDCWGCQGGPLLVSYKWSYGAPMNGLINGFAWDYFSPLCNGVIQLIGATAPQLMAWWSGRCGWFLD